MPSTPGSSTVSKKSPVLPYKYLMPSTPGSSTVSKKSPVLPYKYLVAGGVRVLEVTLRTPVGLAAISAIAREVEGAIVGVGTITRPADFKQALDAGARFGVSPGLTPALIEAAHSSGLPLLPGVMTPSEV